MPTLTLSLRRDEPTLQFPRLEAQVTSAGGVSLSCPLELTPVVVGSDPDCALVCDDAGVSRRHLELRLTEAGIVLRDLGSKNGTFVRGLRVAESELPPGEQVVFGDSRLVVRAAGGISELALSAEPRFGEAWGASPAMRALFALLEKAARTDAPILLLGETGTGKDLLSRAVHSLSTRQAGPFVVFDCSAVPPTLIEAELFGYMKGAFTGANASRVGLLEQAHQGTLVLDEIGELPLELQSRLLRALETRQVRPLGSNEVRPADARVIAATHRDLRSRVAVGQFREDLFYRLAVVVARVPPLRERKEDIPLLVEKILARQQPPRGLQDLPAGSLALLKAHHWPGNVRELSNTLTRLVLFPSLGGQAFEPAAGRADPQGSDLFKLPHRKARDTALERFELAYLTAKLKENGGKVSAAARAMGVSRQFAYLLMDRYGLRDESADP